MASYPWMKHCAVFLLTTPYSTLPDVCDYSKVRDQFSHQEVQSSMGDTGFIHALHQKRNDNSKQWFLRIDAYFKVVFN